MPHFADILNDFYYGRVSMVQGAAQLPTALGSNSALKVERQILTATVTVTTTGGGGAATGSAASAALYGALLDIKLDFHASAPATTDTTISDAFNGNMLVISNSATDAVYRPLAATVDATGAAIAGVYVPWTLNGAVTVSLAQCDALTGAVVATIRYVSP